MNFSGCPGGRPLHILRFHHIRNKICRVRRPRRTVSFSFCYSPFAFYGLAGPMALTIPSKMAAATARCHAGLLRLRASVALVR